MDEQYMQEALKLAREAAAEGEVPVGCVIVRGEEIVGRGRNRREKDRTALGHGEIEAIAEACRNLGGWRLAAVGMHSVCNLRALPYVRRSHHQCPDPSGGVWRVGR